MRLVAGRPPRRAAADPPSPRRPQHGHVHRALPISSPQQRPPEAAAHSFLPRSASAAAAAAAGAGSRAFAPLGSRARGPLCALTMARSRGTARARESEGERRARVKRAGRAAAAGAVVLLRERAKKKAAVETGGAPKALLSKAASSLFFSAMATELRRRPSAPEPERARSAGLAPRVAATRASNWWLRY